MLLLFGYQPPDGQDRQPRRGRAALPVLAHRGAQRRRGLLSVIEERPPAYQTVRSREYDDISSEHSAIAARARNIGPSSQPAPLMSW